MFASCFRVFISSLVHSAFTDRMLKDNIKNVNWIFQAFPSEKFKETFNDALLEYVQGTQDWNYVVKTVKDDWKLEKAQ